MQIGIHIDNDRLENRSLANCHHSEYLRINFDTANSFAKHHFKGNLCIECGGEERTKQSYPWLIEQVRSVMQ